MTDRLWFLFELWLAMMTGGLVHMLVAWYTGFRAGLDVAEFKIFYGKPIVTAHWQGATIMLGWFPFGMYVKFSDETFPFASGKVRGLLPLAGPFAVALGALCFLGIETGPQQIWKSVAQWMEATLHPVSVGVPLINQVFAAQLPWPVFTGILWARYAVFQCFPIPGLAGGAWWFESFRKRSEEVPGWIGLVGFVIIAAAWSSWLRIFWKFVAAGRVV